MTAEEITKKVVDEIVSSGLVEIEVSARHVHLCPSDVDVLFGNGHKLTFQRALSQPGQFLCEERVCVSGPKGELINVAILGPERPFTQVELSVSDAFAIGVKPVLRESGDIADSSPIGISTIAGKLALSKGAIIAKRHIHVPPSIAQRIGLQDKTSVSVATLTARPVVYDDVVIRISDKFRFKMHIDFDEANAAMVSGFTFGKISLSRDNI